MSHVTHIEIIPLDEPSWNKYAARVDNPDISLHEQQTSWIRLWRDTFLQEVLAQRRRAHLLEVAPSLGITCTGDEVRLIMEMPAKPAPETLRQRASKELDRNATDAFVKEATAECDAAAVAAINAPQPRPTYALSAEFKASQFCDAGRTTLSLQQFGVNNIILDHVWNFRLQNVLGTRPGAWPLVLQFVQSADGIVTRTLTDGRFNEILVLPYRLVLLNTQGFRPLAWISHEDRQGRIAVGPAARDLQWDRLGIITAQDFDAHYRQYLVDDGLYDASKAAYATCEDFQIPAPASA